MIENWKEVHLKFICKTKYFVSDLGRCKSVSRNGREKIIKGKQEGNVRIVDYCLEGTNNKKRPVKDRFIISREIAKLFIGQPENSEKYMVEIIEKNRGFQVSNLRWVKLHDVGKRSFKNIKPYIGKPNLNGAKICATKAAMIRKSKSTNAHLAKIFGISDMQVSRIKRGVNWAV